jgi:hypothetical protein
MKHNKPLWDVFDGEAFMENPQLGILGLNPKRRKRGLKMAVRRRRRVHRRGKKSTARRSRSKSVTLRINRPRRKNRRHRRKNWAVGGAVTPFVANPRRRRRSRSNPKRRMHHRRRSNPGFLGFSLPPVKSVLFAGVGFAGPSLVSGFLSSTFPSVMAQTTSMGIAGKYIVKIGSVLGLAWLTRKFVGSNEAGMVLLGGGVNVALTAVNDFMPSLLPANPLSTYVPTSMAGMGAVRGVRGVGTYVGLSGMRGGLGARPALANGAGLMSTGGGAVGRNGAYGGVAARFFRY